MLDDFTGTTTETMMVSKGTINKNTVPSSSNMQGLEYWSNLPDSYVLRTSCVCSLAQ